MQSQAHQGPVTLRNRVSSEKLGFYLLAVGWVGITPIQGLTPPYWAGLWFGLYATWQGVITQIAAAVFVVGSYYLAEGMQTKRRRAIAVPRAERAQ